MSPEDVVERLNAQTPAPAQVPGNALRGRGEDQAATKQDHEEDQNTPQKFEEHVVSP